MVEGFPEDPSHQTIPVHSPITDGGEGKDGLIDISRFQTPRQALVNLRFIINLILGGVVGWVINWVIALVMTAHTTRAALWNSIPDFNDPTTGQFITMYVNPIYLDWFISGLVTAYLGGIIGHFTVKFEVRRAVKRPIHPSYTQGWIYRAIGVHTPYFPLRAVIYTIWGVAIAYPICLIIFAIACGAGGMDMFLRPFDFEEEICYLSRMWFCLNKGFFCIIITTLIAPLIELGALSHPNLTKNDLAKFNAKKQQEFDSSSTTSSPIDEHNAAIAMEEYGSTHNRQ